MKQCPQNIRRAEDARVALDAYEKGSRRTAGRRIADLIADLLHLAQLEGHDPNLVATRAMNYFDAESSDNLSVEETDDTD